MPKSLIHLGTSGFVYSHWRSRFYPHELPERKWLGYYAQKFNTVELNNTFYRLPKQANVQAWIAQVSKEFIFAVKGSRYLTHVKRLTKPIEGLAKFFEAISPLKFRKGPILWQLPPNLKKNLTLLNDFFCALPKEWKHVLEVRNQEWHCPELFDVLNHHQVALCVHDLINMTVPAPSPGAIYYRRFHGADVGSQGRYGQKYLEDVAAQLIDLEQKNIECFVYFNNDRNADAIFDCFMLKEKIKILSTRR